MSRHWPYPRVIAHRGGGSLAPENTLAAIRAGSAMGYTGVEFDVMLAADAVPVVIHDETLERTTGTAGAVAQTPSSALAALDAGGWFGAAFAGEPVPTYTDAARLCLELRLWANVEIKPAAGFEHETGRIVAAASTTLWQTAPAAPLLSSFSVAALEQARLAAPELPRGLLVETIAPDWRESATRLGCVSLHCDQRHLTAAQAGEILAVGFALLCYTVNDPVRARELFSWGVDAIFTDRLDLIPPNFASDK